MALAFSALAAATANTSNNQASHTGNAGTPGAGDLLICCILVSGNTAVGSMSGGGWNWKFLTSFTKNSGADTFFIFEAAATAATSTTPVYTINGNSTGSCLSCVKLNGASSQTSAYIRQINTATGTTANPAVPMSVAILTGNGCLGFAGNGTNSAAQFAVPSGWGTEISEVTYNTPPNSLETAFRNSGETASTITWTNANTTAWGAIVLEFYVAGTGPESVDSFGQGGFFGLQGAR